MGGLRIGAEADWKELETTPKSILCQEVLFKAICQKAGAKKDGEMGTKHGATWASTRGLQLVC